MNEEQAFNKAVAQNSIGPSEWGPADGWRTHDNTFTVGTLAGHTAHYTPVEPAPLRDEIYFREKSIEYAIQATGDRDISLPEFANLLDYFYEYLSTGNKLKF